MILFGHLGLTYFASRTLEKNIGRMEPLKIKVDYRLLFLGSVLPDILDKTIIFFNSNETFKSGRLIGHTFLMTLILFLIGLVLLKKKNSISMLILAFGCFIHQILDSMWNFPDILFWSVYGFPFKNGNFDFYNWINNCLNIFNKENPVISFTSIKDRLFSSPFLAVSEFVGLIIIISFIYKLIKFKQANIFIKSGQVDF